MEQYGAYAGLASIIIVVAREIYNLCNHKRLRSKCCGKDVTAQIDIESTTPPTVRLLSERTLHPSLCL